MGYFGSIRIVSSRTTKKGDNYEKVELESEVFFQPGEVPFSVEGIQESFVSVTERVKNMIENKILGWTTGPRSSPKEQPMIPLEIQEQLEEEQLETDIREERKSERPSKVEEITTTRGFYGTDKVPIKSTPQPNRINTPAYDSEKKRWNYCEAHPDEEIKHFSEKTQRYYYACLKCNEFLQKDGSRKPMGVKE